MSEGTPPATEPEGAFAPIAHDLNSCGLRCRLVFSTPLDEDPRWWRQLVVSGVPVGFLECEATDPATQAKDLALHTQAAVLENLQAIEDSRAWPHCRAGHPHPMSLASDGEGQWPYWHCPKDRSYRWDVGGHPGNADWRDAWVR
ncbi:hypothetical protein [Streptomyces decoyicus]|uniref:hypothetical protein n=1 Tax=Streptomyces decoyicus TaxID=249567 RepID=UPI002E19FB00|nr:hypothetical protein OG532_40290 [Streptomyces decoyicus]